VPDKPTGGIQWGGGRVWMWPASRTPGCGWVDYEPLRDPGTAGLLCAAGAGGEFAGQEQPVCEVGEVVAGQLDSGWEELAE
jgi:hypothetical protein